jgi:hypothetical protein
MAPVGGMSTLINDPLPVGYEIVPPDDALMFDVMKTAQARGLMVISDGRRVILASAPRSGYHRVGACIKNTNPRPN